MNDLPEMFDSTTPEPQNVGFGKDDIMNMLRGAGIMDSQSQGANFFNADTGEVEEQEFLEDPDDSAIVIPAPETPTEKVEEKPQVKKEEPEEEQSTFTFTPAEIQQAKLHLIKPKANWKREYKITNGFTVWLEPANDKMEKMLNEYSSVVHSTGDKRTRVEVIDSYYDEKTKIKIPSGRTETEWYYNADASRSAKRAEMAAYIHTIGDDVLHDLTLVQRLAKLEEYTPHILDIVYEKAFYPFYNLIIEAKRQIRKE